MTKVIRIIAALAVVIGCAAESLAQNENDARGSIQRAAKMGDRLTITTSTGSAIRGHLVSTEADALVLRTSDGERALAYAEIDQVRRRKNGIAAGATAGALAGGLYGGLVALAIDGRVNRGGIVAVASAIGLGVGVGLDALISTNRTIFKRTVVSQGVEIQPQKAGGAVRWAVRW